MKKYFVSLLALLSLPLFAAPARVQSAISAYGTAGANTVPVTLGSTLTQGNLLVLIVVNSANISQNLISSISQTSGGTWTKKTTRAGEAVGPGLGEMEIWYSLVPSAAASKTITPNWTNTAGCAYVMEVSGATVPDKSGGGNDGGTPATTIVGVSTGTLNDPNEIVFEAWNTYNVSNINGAVLSAQTNGFTLDAQSQDGGNRTMGVVFKVVASTAATSSSVTADRSSSWVNGFATFRLLPPNGGGLPSTGAGITLRNTLRNTACFGLL